MTFEINGGRRVIGVKQSKRAILEGTAKTVYVADDSEERIRLPIIDLCGESAVPVVNVPTMDELGKACGIDVGAAVAVVLK